MSATWRILEGDCRDVLRTLPEQSVQTCITSPPYFGLRDYGHDGQIGLEPTPVEFVQALVEVFREVRRVLRDDGTVWLNLGDSYAAGGGSAPYRERAEAWGAGRKTPQKMPPQGRAPTPLGVKPKDLLGIPWAVAFALRADGWYLRSEIIWAKKNCMPESVTDRPTKAHEQVFLLSKSRSYYYDADAIREANETVNGGSEANTHHHAERPNNGERSAAGIGRYRFGSIEAGRNKRSVWTVATAPFSGAHFAVFPPKLIEPCVLAGCPENACSECGAPWVASDGPRALDTSRPQARRALQIAERHGLTDEHLAAIRACGVGDAGKAQVTQDGYGKNDPAVQALADEAKTVLGGYYREFLLARPTRGAMAASCSCDADTVPGTVLDPFSGAGTTGMVALRHGRSYVGIELNEGYAEMSRQRIRDDAPLFNGFSEAA